MCWCSGGVHLFRIMGWIWGLAQSGIHPERREALALLSLQQEGFRHTHTHLGDLNVIMRCWLTQTSEVRIVTAAVREQIAEKENKEKQNQNNSIWTSAVKVRDMKPHLNLSQCPGEWGGPRLIGRPAELHMHSGSMWSSALMYMTSTEGETVPQTNALLADALWRQRKKEQTMRALCLQLHTHTSKPLKVALVWS